MKETKHLDHSKFPEDLKNFSTQELETLASEIRQRLLEVGDACGGHLASNLGVVELTIALHTLFESPTDKFLFDTSHQTYVHKMLTGRLDRIFTIRQDGGLSGFAKITESPHDTFGAGHASTALSAALGIAQARDIQKKDYSVVSIIGDASLSGGMCFEALNNIEKLDSNFICILNDNDMSISQPVGKMADYLTKVRTSSIYDHAKQTFEDVVNKIPKIGTSLTRRVEKAVEHFRDLIIDTKAGVIFEEFGFKYLGPIDGHNIEALIAALKYAKSYQGPIMVHIITQKGKGHLPAEADPVTYHGVSPKPKEENKPKTSLPSYTGTFGKTMTEICNTNDDVVVITPAMKGGSGLEEFAQTHPDKFFDVGIAEEHAVTFAAGLARAGLKPVLAIYSTFLQRGYDQMVHDVCLQNLPVMFALDRSGLVGPDGPTHHGVFDYTFMIPIPNMGILAPKDGIELDAMLKWMVTQNTSYSVRYPKAGMSPRNGQIQTEISTKKAEVLVEFSEPQTNKFDILLIGVGSMAWPSYETALLLHEKNISCAAINLRFVKPLDIETLEKYVSKSTLVVTIEEGNTLGGVGQYIQQSLAKLGKSSKEWVTLGIPDEFADHGSIGTLYKHYGLTPPQISESVVNRLNELSLNPKQQKTPSL